MTDETLTLPKLQEYIETLARLYSHGEPYTIDFTTGRISTPSITWNIVIPDAILNDIKLEEA